MSLRGTLYALAIGATDGGKIAAQAEAAGFDAVWVGNGDQGLALQCLLEGEATLVMVRVALTDLPGADATAEEMLGPMSRATCVASQALRTTS